MRNAVAAVAVALAGACNFAPRYVRPAMPVPEAFPAEYASDSVSGVDAAGIGWRDFIVDQRLEALIAASLEHNRDLRIAVARIEEARGLFRIRRADRLPEIAVSADATRTGGATSADTFDRYAIGVGVSRFELDFWGRVRNLSEAARAQYLATVHAQRAFRLSLIRDVAGTYLALREAEERIALAEATVASRQEGVRIARTRLDAGVTSALDWRQSESLLTQAEAELAGLRLLRARTENALGVLVGGPVTEPMPDPLPLEEQVSPVVLSAGLPSRLLTARPDILAAEELLRAANADIGAARAAFFPSISLTGSFGFVSDALSGLFGGESKAWSFGPSITLPIFTGGRNRGNLTVAQARNIIAIASYEQVIQDAFREVADALAGRRYLAEQVAATERGVVAQRAIAQLAQSRYNEGVAAYIEVLDAQRNLFAVEQALLQLRRAEAENMVTLYVVLGGGM